MKEKKGIRYGGRTSKLPRFAEELKKVLEDPNTFTLTMKELHVYVNHKLKKEEKVNLKTFLKWANPNSPQSVDSIEGITTEQSEEFTDMIEYAKVSQKVTLTGKMLDDSNQNKWGTAWLLERKFDDLKLNQKIELGTGGITLSIEGGSNVQKSLDAIEVDFEDVTNQKMLE